MGEVLLIIYSSIGMLQEGGGMVPSVIHSLNIWKGEVLIVSLSFELQLGRCFLSHVLSLNFWKKTLSVTHPFISFLYKRLFQQDSNSKTSTLLWTFRFNKFRNYFNHVSHLFKRIHKLKQECFCFFAFAVCLDALLYGMETAWLKPWKVSKMWYALDTGIPCHSEKSLGHKSHLALTYCGFMYPQ